MLKNFFAALLIVTVSLGLMSGCGDSKKETVPLKTTTLRADKTALQISAPFELKDDNISAPNGFEGYFKKIVLKTAEENDLAIMAVGYVCDKEKIEAETGQPFTPSIEGAVREGVDNIKTVRTSSDVSDVTINGISGKEITGTLDLKFDGDSKATLCDFRARTFGEGMEVWCVIIIRKPGDDTKSISDAVFNSLKLS